MGAMSDLELGEGFAPSGRGVTALARSTMAPSIMLALDLRKQPWFQGGLGHLDFQANFRHWATMAYLNLDEAVCLTLGVPPTTFSEAELRKFSKDEFDPAIRSWHVGRFIGRRYEVLRRRFDPQTTGEVAIQTMELTDWIQEVDLEVPEKFRKVFLKRFEAVATREVSGGRQGPSVHRRELNSVARLLTAIAIDRYGFQPHSQRGHAPAKLKNIADQQGLEISEETILKFLRLGASFLPK